MSGSKFDFYAGKQSARVHAEGHDHDHDNSPDSHHTGDAHTAIEAPREGPPSEFEIMSRAMQELLEAKGIITAEQVRSRMEQFEEDLPYRGSCVVARAGLDPAFKLRLLEEGKAACAEVGIEL